MLPGADRQALDDERERAARVCESNGIEFDDLILELRDSLGTTVIVVTHELASIFAIADNSVFLDPNTKTQLAIGNPKTLRDECDNFEVRNSLARGEARE